MTGPRCKRILKCVFSAAIVAAFLSIHAAQAQTTGQSASDGASRLNQPRFESRIGNSVDAANGAFILEKEILSIQGGRDLAFNIVHNSLLSGSGGAMGFGWSHEYEAFLDGDPAGTVTVHWDALRKNSFRSGSGSAYEPLDEAVRYDQLVRNSNESWRLTRQDGTIYDFAPGGELTQIGNKVFQFITVARTNGLPSQLEEPIAERTLSLHYTRDGNRMVQAISDEADRYVYFGYDGSRRLTSIRGPVTLDATHHGGSFAPRDIPDNNPNGLTHTINVSRTNPIGLVQLSVANLGHARPADLTVMVVSPSGTQAVIRNPSPNPISPSPNPWDLSGLILDNFDGENPQGVWRVIAIDSAPGSTGSLNGWTMLFSETTNPVRYKYEQGLITEATGPSGERMFANVYDGQSRVAAQDDGVDTNMIAMFAYEATADGGVRTTYLDRMANSHQAVHDSRYRLLSRTDPLDATVAFEYTDSGDRRRLTDALGRATVFGYDSRGNLITVVDPALNTGTMTYDGRNNLTSVRDALGKTTNFEYDSRNNLTRVIDALGNRDRKTYGSSSQLGGSLLEDGAGINYSYTNGMPASANHPAGAGSSRAEYDGIGRPTQLVDADGFATRMEYDSSGNVIKSTDALGKITRTLYDRRNRVIGKVDRRGNVTGYDYDGNDNLIAVTDPSGGVTRYSYDGEDRLIRTVDQRGNVTTATYDAAGRLMSESNALGDTIHHEYDAAGNETGLIDATGVRVNRTVYDERDLPITVEDALGRVTSTTYDAASRATQIRDPLRRTTALKYDELDRLIEARDPLDRAATQQYEPDDVISRMDGPRNSSVRFFYDAANRMTGIETGRGSMGFRYNGRDLLTRETLPTGTQFNYTYDEAGRLTRVNVTGGNLIVPDLIYGYDDNGNLTEVSRKAFSDTSPVVRLSRRYDSLNRLTHFTDASGNTVQYAYDAAGNVTSLLYPDGSRVNYTYDKANRLNTVIDWNGRTTRYSYDANGRLTGIEFPNGTSRTMNYNAAGQVTRRKDLTAQGGVITEYRYGYDAAGQMTAEASAMPPATLPRAVSMTYGSDNIIQTFQQQPVAFDRNGNMTNGPVGNSVGPFSYDHKNNLVSAGSVTYLYDEEDRLIGFTAAGRTTRLVADPRPELSQVLMETGPDGSIRRYVYGIGLIYDEAGGRTRTYHYDHRGSTIALSSDGGSVSGTVAYGPYGEVLSRDGESNSLFLFGGLFGVITDPNGLNYMRFRWYHPEIKRFINQDAHFGQITDIGSLNRYSYAGANPAMRIDPRGEFWTLIGAAAGALYGVVAQAVTDVVSGQKPDWRNYVGAAIGGAVYGGVLASCPACGFAAGAASAASQQLTTSLLKGEPIDPLQLATTTLIGGATGKLFSVAGGRFSKRLVTDAKPASLLNTSSFFRKIPANRAAIRFKPITGNPSSLREIFRVGGSQIRGDAAFWLAAGVATGAYRGAVQRFTAGDEETALSDRGAASPDKRGTEHMARQQINRGNKSMFGEYIHWNFYLDSLRLAARPVPNNPNNLLTSF